MSVISSSIRARVRSGVEPIARGFGRIGLTPNALTLIGFGIAVIAAFAAAYQAWLAAGLLVAFGAVFDLFDGALARATNKTSRLGAFLDSTFDRLGEAVVYIGIVWGLAAPDIEGNRSWNGGPMLAAAAMAASFTVSYARAKSESLGFSSGSRMANIGLAPREVRLVILVLGLVLTGLAGGVGYMMWPNSDGDAAMYSSLGLITILATITTIQRILFVYRQSKSQEVNH
jgi:phosphatidylglycerophosphate synthase